MHSLWTGVATRVQCTPLTVYKSQTSYSDRKLFFKEAIGESFSLTHQLSLSFPLSPLNQWPQCSASGPYSPSSPIQYHSNLDAASLSQAWRISPATWLLAKLSVDKYSHLISHPPSSLSLPETGRAQTMVTGTLLMSHRAGDMAPPRGLPVSSAPAHS